MIWISRYCQTLLMLVALLFVGTFPLLSEAKPWWNRVTIEENSEIEKEIHYERIRFNNMENQPVRAHILSVTGIGDRYIFGVLGSFGMLLPPSEFSKSSEAVVLINGGFFSKKPTRSQGLVVAHNRVLYPPHSTGHIRGAVGFSSHGLLIDWIGMEDIKGHRFQSEKPGWNECHAALGAGPILIKKGQSRSHTDLEGFNKTQHAPRTAIGKTASGLVLLVVIDGRQPDWSAGVTLEELAEIMLYRNAHEALNLDGGGSSAMVVNHKILNQPSDFALPGIAGKQRPIANAVVLLKK